MHTHSTIHSIMWNSVCKSFMDLLFVSWPIEWFWHIVFICCSVSSHFFNDCLTIANLDTHQCLERTKSAMIYHAASASRVWQAVPPVSQCDAIWDWLSTHFMPWQTMFQRSPTFFPTCLQVSPHSFCSHNLIVWPTAEHYGCNYYY